MGSFQNLFSGCYWCEMYTILVLIMVTIFFHILDNFIAAICCITFTINAYNNA